MRFKLCLALAAVCAVAAGAPPTAFAWPTCVARSTPIRTGVSEVSRSQQGRMLTLTLRSRAMQGLQHVNLLLPRAFDHSGRTRYPVLYLLHGAGGSYRAWAEKGDVQKIVGSMQLIVVMPDGGVDGGYSDWIAKDPGRSGPFPAYESYDVRELIPFIDSHLPTRADAGGRAVAGLSMGGHGATKLAAEYPGTFGYVGTFSGAVDIQLPIYQAAIQNCDYDDPAREEVVWRDNNPTALASNLRGVRLFVRSGNGFPGRYDKPGGVSEDVVEAVVYQMAEQFLGALHHAGIRGVDIHFSKGTHSWPYWQQDLREYIPWLR